MGVKFSQLPIAQSLASDDYIAVLDTSEGVLKRTALSNLGGKGIRACYDETTALYDHAVGDIVYIDDTLYKVTAAISVGDTIAVGTNISTDTDITRDDQVYVDMLPGSGGGGGGTVDVDDLFDGSSENPVSNALLTSTLGYEETGTTATVAHATNDRFIFNGIYVKATADIAVGDPLALTINVMPTTISEAISAASGNVPVNPSSTAGMNIWIETD